MDEKESRDFQLDWLLRHPVPRKDEEMAQEARKNTGGSGDRKKARRPPKDPFSVQVLDELDLHGCAVDEALAKAEMFLEGWSTGTGGWLRVIHGRGTASGGAVRAALLRNLKSVWSRRIRSYRTEPGNPGATLIELAVSAGPKRGNV